MPIDTRIDPDGGLRVHSLNGRLQFEEVRDTLEELYSSPDFDPAMNALWDVRDASTADISLEDVRKIAQLVSGRRPKEGLSRVALVVSRDVDFGLARMYEMKLEDVAHSEVRVFRDIEEALTWLGQGLEEAP
jgi:hypothetical protein